VANPVVVRQKVTRSIQHRKPGGQLTGGSENWSETIDNPGWRLYDFAINVISQFNSSATISSDGDGISFNGQTSWNGAFGAGGDYNAEVTAFFWTVFEAYTPSNIDAIKNISKNDSNGYTNAMGLIEGNLAKETAPKPVSLKTSNGNFVTAENGGGSTVVANRPVGTAVGQWETFGLIDLGNNTVVLQTFDGHFVTAENGGGSTSAGQPQPVVANRTQVGAWEKFVLVAVGPNQVALKTSNGNFVTAENGGGSTVVANRTAIGAWETFVLS